MRRNKGLFTGMMLFGAGLAVLSLLLGDRVENAVGGMLMGVGSGLFAMASRGPRGDADGRRTGWA